jgi:hypothetical protein
MKTKTINLYQFAELSDEAKEKAINKLSTINVEHDWWDFVYMDAEGIGLKIDTFDLDRNRHCKGNFTLSAWEVAQNILNSHGDECETYRTAQNFLNDFNPVFAEYMDETNEKYESKESEDKLSDLESDFLNSLLEDYSMMLQNECEYLQSKESIIQTIEANEYDFDEDGNLI